MHGGHLRTCAGEPFRLKLGVLGKERGDGAEASADLGLAGQRALRSECLLMVARRLNSWSFLRHE